MTAPVPTRTPGGLARFLLLSALVLSGCQPPTPASQVLELGDGWEFRLSEAADGVGVPATLRDSLTQWRPAMVPGTIHTDLLTNALIPDPFWRDQELSLQWIGEEDWTYQTVFRVGPEVVERERVEMVFHGLDTFADVYLNGDLLLRADNMFRVWRAPVKDRLLTGENVLQIRFRSPLPEALEALRALPYQLPAGNDRGTPPSRVFVRKAAYHYGWDWGPRFVTAGIWRPIELVAWNGARITDLHLVTDSISPRGAHLTAQVEVEASREEVERRVAGGGIPARLTLSSTDGSFADVVLEAPLTSAVNRFRIPVEILEPRLWWPNGLGEQPLYTVRAILTAGRRTDTLQARIGLRTLELVTEPDSIGESFFFRVNGRPVFMKGANVIPLDHFSPRVRREDYEALFRDVAEANMNMLRVWGGGIYEEDAFYDLADEHGILIWQDFMFANGMYPGDSAFVENVRAEATDQVRRLRGHTSLALWCGNNEIDEAWNNWGWARAYDSPADSASVRNAYDAVFLRVLPQVVATLDPQRPYWPSSPSLGWGDPESMNLGDSHYWGVWHGREPFDVFQEKLPRFASEFGFQSFPPMETIEAFSLEEDRSPDSPVMSVHQKHPVGNELIRTYMASEFPVPSAFDDLVYVSQLLQARGMRTAFEAQRRAMPRTMGTLYWQLNDTWPVVSWSSRDYFGRWKALHYAAREAFAPLLISPLLRGDTLEVWGVSDLEEEVTGELVLEATDFRGIVLFQAPYSVTVAPNASQRLWTGPVRRILGEAEPGAAVFSATFTPGAGQETRQGILYFRPPKDLSLPTPAIRLRVDSAPNGGVLLTLESAVLAKDVYLMLEKARFSENFFDLLPGNPRTVHIETPMTPEQVKDALRIRTLAEVPKEGLERLPGNGS